SVKAGGSYLPGKNWSSSPSNVRRFPPAPCRRGHSHKPGETYDRIERLLVSAMLPAAFTVIERWGFVFKTVGFVWAKQNLSNYGFSCGWGFGTRAGCEICLLATRGHPKRLAREGNSG